MYSWKRSLFSLAIGLAFAAQGSAEDRASDSKKAPVNPAGKYTAKPAAKPQQGADTQSIDSMESLMKSISVEQVSEHKFRIGEVTLNKKLRTVTFPVIVNMNHGVVEYVLVTENGKVHESVFTTKAKPSEIHLACVLLGMKSFSGLKWPQDHTGLPTEHAITVEVTWPSNGPPKRFPLANFVSVIDPSHPHNGGPPIKDGSWFYNGSHFRSGVFTAESEGSIIAVIGDATALLNGLRTGRENDEAHAANQKILPSIGKTVHMVFTLPAAKAKPPTGDGPSSDQ